MGFIDDIAYGVQGQTNGENVHKLQQMLKKAEGWKNRHGAKFEITKHTLIHFTRNRHQKTDTPATIGNVIIQPSQEARYLGVIFNKKLRFK